MTSIILIYLVVGLIYNLYTILDVEVREYWFEFGILGFILQLIVSVILFPLIWWVIYKDYIRESNN